MRRFTSLPSFARWIALLPVACLGASLPACTGDTEPETSGTQTTTSDTTSTDTEVPCAAIGETPIPLGDETGHQDPFGAKAAGQARAGRLTKESDIVQPAHGRQKVRVGDYVLVNDKIAVTIEDKGLSDGYARFGGEILAIDRVGDDGRPRGVSYYNEMLMGITLEMIHPESVTVLKDGSEGGDAVIRVAGKLDSIPFLAESFAAVLGKPYGLEGAVDYTLSPGSERIRVQMTLVNRTENVIDLGDQGPSKEMFGFFHYSRSQAFTPERGYATPAGFAEWVGFDSGLDPAAWSGNGLPADQNNPSAFAFRLPDGPIEHGISQSGFMLFWGPGFALEACSTTTRDHVDIISSEGGTDALRQAVLRATGETEWRAVTGKVTNSAGEAISGAFVHVQNANDDYLGRTMTAEDGTFTVHAPPGESIFVTPQKRGFAPHQGASVASDATTVDLSFVEPGFLHVTVEDKDSNDPLPVRVQVIPKTPLTPTPEAFGVDDERDGRLYQDFAVTGDTTLRVPAGEHHLIVSRGYEWEIFESDEIVAPGETKNVAVSLERSVDSTGRMCADFHIHSFHSADSNDPVLHKVKGALADGLDIPVSSEHEWVVDFQPVIASLGAQKWAFGVASEELTTFTWGHFGVVPMAPDPDKHNNGAVDWVGHSPKEVFSQVDAETTKPALIVNHPRGGFSFGAYFTASQLDRETGLGKVEELWDSNFDAIEVFNDSDVEPNREKAMADWFALLNHGMKVWAVGSSDSHGLRSSPVGYPRTCLYFGHDDPSLLTPAGVRDAVLSGNSIVSGGLYMTVTGPNGEVPGESAPGGTFTITVEAPTWIGVDSLEVIVNGETVSTEALLPVGGGKAQKFMNQVTVMPGAGAPASWVVFHAKGSGDLTPIHPGRRPFAVSNPIFLQ